MQVTARTTVNLIFHRNGLVGGEEFKLNLLRGGYADVPDWVLENTYFKMALVDRLALVEVKSEPTQAPPSSNVEDFEALKNVMPTVGGDGVVVPAEPAAATVPVPVDAAPLPLAKERVRKNVAVKP